MKRNIAILAMLVVLASGCSNTPPETVEYLLRPQAHDGVTQLESDSGVVLGRLSVAPYLDRDQIVLEANDHRIVAARNHRWTESLSQSLRRVLQVGIGRAAGLSVGDTMAGAPVHNVIIDINIHQFHGSMVGDVKLVADWRLRSGASGDELGSFEFSRHAATRADGYDALVQTQIALLDQFAVEIAATVRQVNVKGESQ